MFQSSAQSVARTCVRNIHTWFGLQVNISSVASVVMQRRRRGDDDCGDGGRVDCDSAATGRKHALFNFAGEHGSWAGKRRAFCDSTCFGHLRKIGCIIYLGRANMICPTVDVNNLGTSDQQTLANLFVDTPRTPSLILWGGSSKTFSTPLQY